MNFIRQFFTFSSSVSPEAMSAAKTKAQKIIDENAVAVFSKSYCPYCSASKKLLDSMGAKYHLVELDEVSDGSDIQAALAEISGQRTVPNIFIGKEHIGGNSDLQAKSGELKALLKEVGAC
ncbi:putative glutaredoxin [Xylariaceae sp. FL0255]|nr:putative glutaredoxin [Xylariaceae sp. FL0255]